MVKIHAFQALRPVKKLVDKIPTKAYSNYSKADVIKEKKDNEFSFLNIIHQEHIQDLTLRFQAIRDKINDFKIKKILETDIKNNLYIYQQVQKENKYTGLICAIDLKEYKNNNIKIHEKTISKRERLFAKYLSISKINAEPVLLTHENNQQIIEDSIPSSDKIYQFKSLDNTKHTIWRITKPNTIHQIINNFKNINQLYIADGHHRMASSLKHNINSKCLAYILPKNQLKTYAFHRVLSIHKNYNTIIKKLNQKLNIKQINTPRKKSKKLQFYINKKWYEISNNSDNNKLLVEELLNTVLKPIFNIKNEKNNQNIRFIPGNKTIKQIIKNVTDNEILFFMQNIDINTVINIAKKNKTTPPKSTFITPKIPSGLIMMELK